MDILLISINNQIRILHISNQEDKIDYSIYDNYCTLLDGGVIDLGTAINNDTAIENVVDIINDQFEFSQPYIYVPAEITEELLELIQEADYQNMQAKVHSISSYNPSKEESENELEMV